MIRGFSMSILLMTIVTAVVIGNFAGTNILIHNLEKLIDDTSKLTEESNQILNQRTVKINEILNHTRDNEQKLDQIVDLLKNNQTQ